MLDLDLNKIIVSRTRLPQQLFYTADVVLLDIDNRKEHLNSGFKNIIPGSFVRNKNGIA